MTLQAVPDSASDAAVWPDHWSDEAVEAVEVVLEASPNLDGAAYVSLLSAAELLTAAHELDELARAAGYLSTGSQGQLVLHPAATEARQRRQAATAILARLGDDADAGPTRAQLGRNLARARWSR